MNSFHLCLILGALVTMAASQNTPKIKTASTNKVGIIGDTILLECSVENNEGNVVMWSRGHTLERRLLSMGETLLCHDNRYSATFDRNSSTYKFEIRDLDFSDAGLYQCLLPLAADNILTSDVEVQVLPKPGEVAFDWNATKSSPPKSEEVPNVLSQSLPKITRITRISPTQIAEVGGNVTLECAVENLPSTFVFWIEKPIGIYERYYNTAVAMLLRDCRVTHTTTDNTTLSTFKLENLKLEDAKSYQCVAIASPDDLITADVEVQVRPKPAE